jgi:hypothetical protein
MIATPLALLALVVQTPIQGPPAPPPSSFYWFDLDADGDQDALALEPGGTVRLLRNAGAGAFVEDTEAWALGGLTGVANALIGDSDRDGLVDLVLSGPAGVRLLRQAGGAFVDVTVSAGLAELGPVASASWVDANGDRAPDLHLVAGESHRVFASGAGGLFRELDLGLFEPSQTAVTVGGAGVTESGPAVGAIGEGEERPRERVARDGGGGGGRVAASVPGVTITPGSVPPPTGGGMLPSVSCVSSITDQTGAGCLEASTVPTLGMLYPLGNEFYIDAVTGNVGVGTTSPGYALEVAGQIVSGTGNTASGLESAMGGGKLNSASGDQSTIAGGESNVATALGAFVGGGTSNSALSERAVVVGGVGNRAAYRSFVGGGDNNRAAGNLSTVAGGKLNDALQGGAAIGGGEGNVASATYTTIAGGRSNAATGSYGSIPGGDSNSASGAYSLAAGRRAKALHDGAFVWADSTDADFASTAPDQFVVRAAGGMGVGKVPDPSYQVDVEGALQVSDTINSTKPSGAPFSVASSALNTNLNADFLDGLDASAFSQFGFAVDEGEIANGAVTGAKIASGEVTDSHVNAAAAIAGAKIAPDFGAQDVVTTGRVAIGTSTLGEQLTVAGTVESTSGGFKFPDGSVQITAGGGGTQGPPGPEGPPGPSGSPGPQGPPGVGTELPEPTVQIGTITLAFPSSNNVVASIYAFEQKYESGPSGLPEAFDGSLSLMVTADALAQTAYYQQGALWIGGGDTVDLTIVLDRLDQGQGATLTITVQDAYVWELENHEHDLQGAYPREDVTFKVQPQGDATWTFDDGQGGVSSEVMGGTCTNAGCWGGSLSFTGPLQYQVWEDQLGPTTAGYEGAWAGRFEMSWETYQVRTLSVVKPVGPGTVHMLNPGSATSFAHNNPLAILNIPGGTDLVVEFMNKDGTGQVLPSLRYEFDLVSLVGWGIRSNGDRLEETLVFENASMTIGVPGTGTVSADLSGTNTSVSW